LNSISARYIIGNTKRISEFKELVTGPSFNDEKNGIGFLLNDKSLTAAVSPVEKSLGIMEIMFPYVYVVITFISFSVSYILMHNRKKEMAMMLSIGEGKGRVLAVTAMESLMNCVAGSIVGLAVFSICFKYQALSLLISNNAIIYITTYIAASTIGSILCTVFLIRLDVIKMLSMGE
jgi:ABC-type antimicrobial peptide transport system permease subunit